MDGLYGHYYRAGKPSGRYEVELPWYARPLVELYGEDPSQSVLQAVTMHHWACIEALDDCDFSEEEMERVLEAAARVPDPSMAPNSARDVISALVGDASLSERIRKAPAILVAALVRLASRREDALAEDPE